MPSKPLKSVKCAVASQVDRYIHQFLFYLHLFSIIIVPFDRVWSAVWPWSRFYSRSDLGIVPVRFRGKKDLEVLEALERNDLDYFVLLSS